MYLPRPMQWGQDEAHAPLQRRVDPKYQYISVENDVETGLYETGPRLYDPWRAQFLSPDTLAGDSTLSAWSPYGYSLDNPIRFEDPTGKWPGGWGWLNVASSWLATEQAQFGSWVRNSLGFERMSSEQMQAETDYQSSDLMIPTSAQMSKQQFQTLSNFVYAEGMGSAGATSVVLSLSGAGMAFEGLSVPSAFLSLGSTAATFASNYLSRSDLLLTGANVGLGILGGLIKNPTVSGDAVPEFVEIGR